MKIMRIVLIGSLVLTFCGYAGLTSREQRVLSGGAIGAGVGAAISAVAGGPILLGTAVGTAAGAVGGLIVDEMKRH
jgi:hypothetical protein